MSIDLTKIDSKIWIVIISILLLTTFISGVSAVYSYNKSVVAEADLKKLKAEKEIDDPYNEKMTLLEKKNTELARLLNSKKKEVTVLTGLINKRNVTIGNLEKSLTHVRKNGPNIDSIRKEIQNEDAKGVCDDFSALGFSCKPTSG